MDGLCDVKGCGRATYMGWRPLTERRGRQICEYHWNRHQDKQDSFDLFDEFKFRRPAGIYQPVAKKYVPRCACGRDCELRRRFCTACAAERKRQRNRQYYHGKKDHQTEPIKKSTLKCKQCGGSRLPGYSYCQKCSQRRGKQSNRERQRQHYRKSTKRIGLT
jgi:hypothetical protein